MSPADRVRRPGFRERFATLLPRALVAVVFVPILIWAGLESSWQIWIIINASFALATVEWHRFAAAKARRIRPSLFGATVLLVLNTGFCPDPTALPLALALSVMAIAIDRTLRSPVEGITADLGVALAGVLYLGVLGSFLPRLLTIPDGLNAITNSVSLGSASFLMLLLMTWCTDTAAYFSGVLFGKHPLMPAVSPKKTVEGLAGGVAGAAFGGWIASVTFAPFLGPWHGLGLGAALAVIGQLGDLVESSLKRDAGVKDASKILPGHGGILDRLDSLLFTAPCAYAFLHLVVL